MVKLSIIILSYNSKTDLERLFLSLGGSEGVLFTSGKNSQVPTLVKRGDNGYLAEVIVIDNGSTDGTGQWLEGLLNNPSFDLSRPDVHRDTLPTPGEGKFELLRNTNTGFAHGNNLGIRRARGKYILLLNPDTKVEKDTLKTTLEFIEKREDVGIVTCKVILENGKLDLACRRRFPNPWNALARFLRVDGLFNPLPQSLPPFRRGEGTSYNMLDTDENQSMEIDSCMGAFLLIRKSVVEKIGLLDEKFFMYGEDIDWCWRCKEAGFKVWYHPTAFITHFKGSSSRKVPFRALKWFHEAMWIFYQKYYAKKYLFIFNWAVFLAIYIRLFLLTAINYFKKSPKVSG